MGHLFFLHRFTILKAILPTYFPLLAAYIFFFPGMIHIQQLHDPRLTLGWKKHLILALELHRISVRSHESSDSMKTAPLLLLTTRNWDETALNRGKSPLRLLRRNSMKLPLKKDFNIAITLEWMNHKPQRKAELVTAVFINRSRLTSWLKQFQSL